MQRKIFRFYNVGFKITNKREKEMADYYSDNDSMYSEEEAMVGVPEHVSKDMFTHVQSVPIDIEVTASPEDLERNPELCIWKMQSQLTKHFKQNLATHNRMNARSEDLRGNLDRILPLGFDVEMQANTFPYAMGMDIPGMMRSNVHRTGVCTYRLPPHLSASATSKSIFDPENKVGRHAYENYKLCTLEDLQHDIEFKAGRHQQDDHALVTVGSLAYDTLVKSIKNGAWRDEMTRQEIEHIFNPSTYSVEVPHAVGNDIKEFLLPDVEQTAKSFINIADFNIRIHRADGEKSFISPKKIAGAINQTAGGKNTSTKINMDALQRNCTFYIKGLMHYVTF